MSTPDPEEAVSIGSPTPLERMRVMTPALRAMGVGDSVAHALPVLLRGISIFDDEMSGSPDGSQRLHQFAQDRGVDSVLLRRATEQAHHWRELTSNRADDEDTLTELLDLSPLRYEVVLLLSSGRSTARWVGGFVEAMHHLLVADMALGLLGGTPHSFGLLAPAPILDTPRPVLQQEIWQRRGELRRWADAAAADGVRALCLVLLAEPSDPERPSPKLSTVPADVRQLVHDLLPILDNEPGSLP